MAQNAVMERESAFRKEIWTPQVFAKAVTACGGDKEAANQFMAAVLDVYHEGGEYLQKCNSQQILAECMKAAQLHLPMVKSLGYSYIVPFNNVPTFVIGWRGLVQLAQNTGKYRYINADAVYEGETVKKDRLSGNIEIGGEATSDKPIGYFAFFELLNGFKKTVYMTRQEMEAYGRKYSKTYNKGPWQTDFDAMARKTVLRKVLKFGPASTQLQKAEQFETQQAEVYAQAEVVQNANKGPVVSIPKPVEQQASQPVETPAPAPEF